MRNHIDIRIFGKVQGVFFRYSAKSAADKLKVTGFIQNESDGSVYIEAEGKKERLKKFLQWCRRGTTLAKVTKIEARRSEVRGYSEFAVKRDAK